MEAKIFYSLVKLNVIDQDELQDVEKKSTKFSRDSKVTRVHENTS